MKSVISKVLFVCGALLACSNVVATPTVKIDPEGPSSVVVLTDANFEHLTQATTGSTTGPWFVKFYAPWCHHCRKMTPAWEKLAKDLKGTVNVADIDVTKNVQIGKRFAIRGYPTLILLKDGKMYHYEGGDRSTESLTAFVTAGHLNLSGIPVPPPLSLFGHVSDFLISGVHEAQRIYDAAFRGFFTIATFSFLFGVVAGMIFSVALLTRKCPHSKKAPVSGRKKD
ncbi:protein disulfide isomerase, putative [Theileria equi strain WA]|uniref:Protein disulfide isomerase, putative n=1 Tax=Theileria equi strain WA TaxID=1537102 RepID=L0AVB9_THEEQ|nr:protein disulfide isomerase, putative [Theileria equi strain WA]AFZ79557.1 protein disulfide isomerase, putative [Theileria equi strain WA]|eukprot:XP_004829223.1 protein disulfide isomerase, putative [Theileria equi strain WA]